MSKLFRYSRFGFSQWARLCWELWLKTYNLFRPRRIYYVLGCWEKTSNRSCSEGLAAKTNRCSICASWYLGWMFNTIHLSHIWHGWTWENNTCQTGLQWCKHFDWTIWVCVSNDFNTKTILQSIIECSMGQNPNLNNTLEFTCSWWWVERRPREMEGVEGNVAACKGKKRSYHFNHYSDLTWTSLCWVFFSLSSYLGKVPNEKIHFISLFLSEY